MLSIPKYRRRFWQQQHFESSCISILINCDIKTLVTFFKKRGTKTLQEILSERETIAQAMQVDLDAGTEPWGVQVERVEM